jgi:hypothetical protein
MTHHMLTGTIAALALVGSTAAQAQGVYVVEPYAAPPVYVAPPAYLAPPVYTAPPVVVAPAPGYVPVVPPRTYIVPRDDYAYVPPAPYVAPPATGYITVDSVTGRRCTIKPDGYRWCWTP